MNEEELILAVQEYPNLYDLSHPKYHDKICKFNSWEEIGVKMNMDGSECQKKWRSLRECYRKSLRSRITKSGQAAKPGNPWRLERQMQFLKPYIQEKSRQISNLDDGEEENGSNMEESRESDLDNDLQVNNENPDSPTQTTDVVADSENLEIVAAGSSSDIVQEASTSKSKPKTFAHKKKTLSKVFKPGASWKSKKPLPPTASVFKEYVELKKKQFEQRTASVPSEPATHQQRKDDHLTKFFQSAEETTRTFPPYLQIKVKSEINKIIAQAEYESLDYTGSYQQDNHYNMYSSNSASINHQEQSEVRNQLHDVSIPYSCSSESPSYLEM